MDRCSKNFFAAWMCYWLYKLDGPTVVGLKTIKEKPLLVKRIKLQLKGGPIPYCEATEAFQIRL